MHTSTIYPGSVYSVPYKQSRLQCKQSFMCTITKTRWGSQGVPSMCIFSQSGSVALIRCPTFKHEFTTNSDICRVLDNLQWATHLVYINTYILVYTQTLFYGDYKGCVQYLYFSDFALKTQVALFLLGTSSGNLHLKYIRLPQVVHIVCTALEGFQPQPVILR